MTKKFNLSEEECNILAEEVFNPAISVIEENEEEETTISISEDKEFVFRKGFFKEDVKEFIKREKEVIEEVHGDYILWRVDKLAGKDLV